MAGTTARKTAGQVGSTAQVPGEETLVNRGPGHQRVRRNVLADRHVVRQPIGGPIGSTEGHNNLLVTDKGTQEMRAKTGHSLHEQGLGRNPRSDTRDPRATTAVRSDVNNRSTIGTRGKGKRELLDGMRKRLGGRAMSENKIKINKILTIADLLQNTMRQRR